MINIVEKNIPEVARLCREHKVKRLEIFGSAVGGEFKEPDSDLDFLVEFLPLDPGEHSEVYFGLLEALEELFGCHVDLVMLVAVKNPYFLEAIDKTRKVIYAA
ncbi:MAG: hypothetical protein E3J72_21380 [Planctomycetota bacterium]|nr:MAG: hypothetical protein E3J72_21380 [Planctomycetota bacterium]